MREKSFFPQRSAKSCSLLDRSTIVRRGVPDHIRSDNGKLRDELLQREAFDTLLEANSALRAMCEFHPHADAPLRHWDTAPSGFRRGWSI